MLKILINCFNRPDLSALSFSCGASSVCWLQTLIPEGLKDIMQWDSWDRVNCLAKLKGEVSLNRSVIVQVAKGSFSHIALIAAFALSILDRRIWNLQGSFSEQDLTDVPCFRCEFLHMVLEGLTDLKSWFADDDKRWAPSNSMKSQLHSFACT